MKNMSVRKFGFVFLKLYDYGIFFSLSINSSRYIFLCSNKYKYKIAYIDICKL